MSQGHCCLPQATGTGWCLADDVVSLSFLLIFIHLRENNFERDVKCLFTSVM